MDNQKLEQAVVGMVFVAALSACVTSNLAKLGLTVAALVGCGEKVAKGIWMPSPSKSQER